MRKRIKGRNIKVERYQEGIRPEHIGGKTGLFFAPEGESDPAVFGDYRVKATIPRRFLFKGKSSLDTLRKLAGKSKRIKDIIDKQVNELSEGEFKNLKAFVDAYERGDTEEEWSIPQPIIRSLLGKKGYSGAHWTNEEDVVPEQLQIWKKGLLRKIFRNKAKKVPQ